MSKMHLVTILYKGNIFTAFVTFSDGKPKLSEESFQKLTQGMVRINSAFSIG